MTISVVGLVDSSYACNFVQPLDRSECTCALDEPSACRQTRSVHCITAESPCKLITPVHAVDVAGGQVTCQNPLWTCKGHNASVQLMRMGTERDVVCTRATPDVDLEPVTRLLQISAGSTDLFPVHYSWGFSCSVATAAQILGTDKRMTPSVQLALTSDYQIWIDGRIDLARRSSALRSSQPLQPTS